MDVDDQDVPEEDEDGKQSSPAPQPMLITTKRGRKVVAKIYKESSDGDEPEDADEIDFIDGPHAKEEHSSAQNDFNPHDDDDDDDDNPPRYPLRNRGRKRNSINGFISSDDDDTRVGRITRGRSRPSSSQANGAHATRASNSKQKQKKGPPPRQSLRRARASSKQEEQDGNYEDEGSSSSGGSGAGSVVEEGPEDALDDLDAAGDADAEGEPEVEEQENDGKPYAFRQRAKVNYAILPPIEELKAPPPKHRSGKSGGRSLNRNKAPGWSATGAELSRWMGGGDDSDSDFPSRNPRKNLGLGGAGGGLFAGSAGAGGLLPGDLAAAAGTPSNLGKIGDAALADADPLGVNQNVTFDEVGGLDDHINALKEMTLLPLLYPEVFQRFNLTPPRGVLFPGRRARERRFLRVLWPLAAGQMARASRSSCAKVPIACRNGLVKRNVSFGCCSRKLETRNQASFSSTKLMASHLCVRQSRTRSTPPLCRRSSRSWTAWTAAGRL